MVRKHRKWIGIASLSLVAVLAVSIFAIRAKAFDVIYEDKSPAFKLANYAGTPLSQNYKPHGEILYDGSLEYQEGVKEYSIRTNSFVWWDYEDNLTFAYNKYTLSYGDQSRITVQGSFDRQIVETEGKDLHTNASVGVAIRGENDKASNGVYLHIRDSVIMVVYRDKSGNPCKPTEQYNITQYPVSLKLEKTGNLFTPSFKCGTEKWVKMKSIAVVMGETVYAGVAAHSTDRDTTIRCNFRDYSVVVEGPDGSTYEPGDDSGGGKDPDEPKNEPAVRPDPEVTGNILFRETFTDGSLVNTDPDDEIINPIWTNDYSIDGEVQTAMFEVEDGNQYWRRNFSTGTYFFPNKKWADYSTSVDLKFGPNNDFAKTYTVDMYVRFKANRQSGFYGYLISLENGNAINIYKIASIDNPKGGTRVATAKYEYVSNEWHTWRIDAFDNTISVYCDDGAQPLLTYTDQGDRSTAVIGLGGIGFGTSDCDVMVDNIVVRQLEDLFGGDWDNKIGGNWNDPIPDYIREYSSKIE